MASSSNTTKPRLKPLLPTGDAEFWLVNGRRLTLSGCLITVYGRWEALRIELRRFAHTTSNLRA